MPQRNSPELDRPRPEESPVAWFSELLIAIDRGEYARATKAQKELSRLGWSVIPRKSRRAVGGGR
jgi:hypothetical protein